MSPGPLIVMCFNIRTSPLYAKYVVGCGETNQVVRICFIECSVALSSCLVERARYATIWAILQQQHPITCVLTLEAVRYKLTMSLNAAKPTKWCVFALLNAPG